MNSRARNRLIAISVVLAIVAASALIFFLYTGSALSITVDKLYDSPEYIGESVQIRGTVVAGSWDRQTNPMTFRIFDDSSDSNAEITIIYSGLTPANFGDGTEAIITGRVEANNVVVSGEMTTVCPSRYETNVDTLAVSELFDGDSDMTDIPVRVSARVVAGSITPPGSTIRLVVHDIADPSIEMSVRYSKGIPDTIDDGVPVILTGKLTANGVFDASDIANIE
ncbi:MAG: cytochrome c maturation protein CcmE [Coriobacteriia bacterium]|nr:cytochrome c maturation protein CcmE [Coriobacteriia bacterium]